METTISSTASYPPAKPQRSFRHKREEERETTTYLEGCEYMKEEVKRLEEEVARRSLEEKNKGCDGEAEEEEGESSGFYQIGEDGRSETATDEDKCSEDGEEKDGRKESREEKKEWRREEEVEEAGEEENRREENGKERRSSEEEEAARGNMEEWGDEKMEEEGWREEEGGDDGEKERSEEDEETDISRDSGQSSRETEDDETGGKNQEDTMKNGTEEEEGEGGGGGGGGEPSSFLPCPGRRSRVIRLYQYNEDGQRYGHLPDSAPSVTGPAPRLKQRSLSLTRLNAIMAAASAGPLDASQRETKREEREERPHFHMEI